MENMSNIEKVDLEKVDWRSSREFFESLGEELDKLDDKDESYNFTWVGKRKSIVEAGAPINKTIRPDMDASKDFDNTKNMLIVGDNLDALKLLQESYLGKIKMIYIDPPYNTGHDFVYHDNFTIKKSDFDDVTTDSDGNIIISEDEYAENSKANGRFHSDWLSMIYPRLKLARNLLTDDGVVFISIDENEQANLREVCNEIFGEDCFVCTFVWRKTTNPNSTGNNIAIEHEYILCFSKNNDYVANPIALDSSDLEKYTGKDEYVKERGPYKLVGLNKTGTVNDLRPNLMYDIAAPDGSIIKPNPRWRWSKEKFEKGLREDRIVFNKSYSGWSVSYKQYLNEDTDGNIVKRGNPLKTILDDAGRTTDGTLDLNTLIGKGLFDFSKPTSLIHKLLLSGSDPDSYILDFFAGSGTTGHAVMNLNAEDGGSRKYILVQLDEKTDEKSAARNKGYETIDQITAERLRKAGEDAKNENIDTGLRVFRIDGSNENTDVRKPLDQISQSNLFSNIDNIKADRTPLDLLFGVVYASALPFDLKLGTKKIGDNTVYLYGYLDEDSGLVACFDDNIPEDAIKEIAKLKPLTAAFKDSSFQDSAAKINLSEQFRVIAPDTKVKVI